MNLPLYANNAATAIAADITSLSTTISVAAGTGFLFGTISTGDYMWLTLSDALHTEIIKVSARAGDTLTVTRGQQGTIAASFLSGSAIACRMTAQGLAENVSLAQGYAAAALVSENAALASAVSSSSSASASAVSAAAALVSQTAAATSAAASVKQYAEDIGTANAKLALYPNASPTLVDGFAVLLHIAATNTTTTPTFAPTLGGVLQTARTIVRFVGNVTVPVVAGDLQGYSELVYNSATTVWVLQNPPLTGNASQTFAVAPAIAAWDAVNLGQLQNFVPTMQKFLSGAGTYGLNRMFQVPAGCNATVGATYTNNGNTYTVYATVVASNYVIMGKGSGTPTASGILTKATGAGDATITFSAVNAPKAIKVHMVGGGAGGVGGGTNVGGGVGTGGGTTTFGTSLLTATGGSVGSNTTILAGAGGTATISAPATGNAIDGAIGNSMTIVTASAAYASGGSGGATAFGGAGSGSVNAVGGSAVANTGSGGGGGGTTTVTVAYGGCGGSAGGYIDALIVSPSATYAYAVGAGGTAGTAGIGGAAGGAGGSGIIIVEEYYV